MLTTHKKIKTQTLKFGIFRLAKQFSADVTFFQRMVEKKTSLF
jgi:hypothetical protein